VENALLELGNVSSAVADHESGLVKFDAAGEVDFAAIREAIEREGYELASA
jgi:copper chaperone CopZ